jgi:hypothetical protein
MKAALETPGTPLTPITQFWRHYFPLDDHRSVKLLPPAAS